MKRSCSVCKIEKDLEEFYKSKIEKLGREYRCKLCTHLKYKDYRARKGKEWNEKTKLAQKKKVEEDPDYFKKCYIKYKGKEKMNEYRERFKERDKKKWKAHKLIQYRVKMKYIVKPENCSKCNFGSKRMHAHHEDYNKPLEVIWFCPKCHHKADKERRLKESL